MPFINTPDLRRLNWPESRYMPLEDARKILDRIDKINMIKALIRSSCKSCQSCAKEYVTELLSWSTGAGRGSLGRRREDAQKELDSAFLVDIVNRIV